MYFYRYIYLLLISEAYYTAGTGGATTSRHSSLKPLSHCPEIDPGRENEGLHDVREFVGMPKISRSLRKLMLMEQKHNWGSYDGLRCVHEWPNLYTKILQSLANLEQCEACLIICPSGINFRTV